MMPFCFSLLHLSQQEKYLYARFEKESRYYVIRLEQDLFGDWIISQINGQIKSHLGQKRMLAFESAQDALEQFSLIAHVRYQRNYHIAGFMSTDIIFYYLIFFLITENDNTTPISLPKKSAVKRIIKNKKPIPNTSLQRSFDFN